MQILLVVSLLFAKTVYQELDVDTEMQHGLLPGALALTAKFVPTIKQVTLHLQLERCIGIDNCTCVIIKQTMFGLCSRLLMSPQYALHTPFWISYQYAASVHAFTAP